MPKARHKYFKRLRKKRHPAHTLLIAIAIVMLWWGIWTILDNLFLHNPFVSGIVAILVGLVIIYFDDFRLKELD